MAPPVLTATIVGAQKAGTTSLLRYLNQHPDLSGQMPVECAYFENPVEWQRGWENAYARYFYSAATERLVAKAAGLYMSSAGLQRLAQHNPRCALIFIVRDPVDRAFSAYRMEQAEGWLDCPFSQVITALGDKTDRLQQLLIEFGEYAPALQRIREFVPAARVKVLIYEDFVKNPADTCREVFRYLDVEDSVPLDTAVVHNPHRAVASRQAAAAIRWLRRPNNSLTQLARRVVTPRTFDTVATRILAANRKTGEAAGMSSQEREQLADYYRPLNRELEALLGRDLTHWSGMQEK